MKPYLRVPGIESLMCLNFKSIGRRSSAVELILNFTDRRASIELEAILEYRYLSTKTGRLFSESQHDLDSINSLYVRPSTYDKRADNNQCRNRYSCIPVNGKHM